MLVGEWRNETEKKGATKLCAVTTVTAVGKWSSILPPGSQGTLEANVEPASELPPP